MSPTAPPRIVTRVGHSGNAENPFLGHATLGALAGTTSAGGLMVLAVTGRLLPAADQEVLDLLMATCTLADPRIWPLKAARLGACYGSALHGIALGTVLQDCRFVGGPAASPPAAQLLLDVAAEVGDALDDPAAVDAAVRRQVARRAHLGGYGVPFRATDIRIEALERLVRQRGRERGRFWRLHQAVAAVVRAERRLEPNVSAGVAALSLDLGLTVEHLLPLSFLMTYPTVLANAVEEAAQQNPAMQALPPAAVRYAGPAARQSPRALSGSSR